MWTHIVLLIVLSICVITDLKNRKIYNIVIFPAMVFAFLFHVLSDGWAGLGFSLLGFTLGLAILIIPFLMGGMGAGDVKLLALVGALQGAEFVFSAAVYMALIGSVMALAIVLFKDGIRERLQFAGFILICLRFRIRPNLQGYWTTGAYPYGVAIAGGAAVCLWLKGWGAG
ncbi:prepilin peptidase [Cohnella sp.]|uniref:A24 family peptidase n=1 Tax=Cohnella sp. TaxID=1883426 RepID=UPI0035636B30